MSVMCTLEKNKALGIYTVFPLEVARPGFLRPVIKKCTVINRLYLIHLPLSFFLVTDENSESDSDTEEKLKGKANV